MFERNLKHNFEIHLETKLSFLSGLLPPQFYSIYDVDNDCPLSLDCYKSFDKGLELSKKFNKPILLDFTVPLNQ